MNTTVLHKTAEYIERNIQTSLMQMICGTGLQWHDFCRERERERERETIKQLQE
jgi:hypothetical protein